MVLFLASLAVSLISLASKLGEDQGSPLHRCPRVVRISFFPLAGGIFLLARKIIPQARRKKKQAKKIFRPAYFFFRLARKMIPPARRKIFLARRKKIAGKKSGALPILDAVGRFHRFAMGVTRPLWRVE